MAPLGSEPAVIEVEPSDHGTDVEGGINGVKLEGCSRHLGAVGDDSAGDDGAKELRALLELQTLEAAAQGVHEDPSSSVELFVVCISIIVDQLSLSRYYEIEIFDGLSSPTEDHEAG